MKTLSYRLGVRFVSSILIALLLVLNLSCKGKLKESDQTHTKPEIEVEKPEEATILPLSLEALQAFFTLKYSEDKGEIREANTIIPLQMHGSIFEYESKANLYRYDLSSHQKSSFKNVFRGSKWSNRSNYVRFDDIENWIVSDAEHYYFETYYNNQDPDSESAGKDNNSYYLECKDRKTLLSKWKVKVADDEVDGFPQRIILYKDFIFIFNRASLSMKCIDKNSGSLRWTFSAQAHLPYVSLPDSAHHNNSVLGRSRVSIKHMYGNYLLVNVYSFDTRAKTENPYLFSETIDKDYLLSLDGKVIREIPDASFYYQDLYFFQNDLEYGMKSIFDDSIQWKRPLVEEYPLEEETDDLPYLVDEKTLFYLTENYLIHRALRSNGAKIETDIGLFDIRKGIEIFKKTYPFYVFELKEHLGALYFFCSPRARLVGNEKIEDLMIFKVSPSLSQEDLIHCVSPLPSSDWDIDIISRGGWDLVSAKDRVLAFSRNGFFVIENERATFFSYTSMNKDWTIAAYWDVSVYAFEQSILLAFTNDSESSGGGYMVFTVEQD
jgi:hypothetical protein